jgi:hypothetical protein
VTREKTSDGKDCSPSEVDDWTAIVCDFENGGNFQEIKREGEGERERGRGIDKLFFPR